MYPDIPRISTELTVASLYDLWDWIKKEFKNVIRKIIEIIATFRNAFDFIKLKANRIVMWKYVQLLFNYSTRAIDTVTWDDAIPKDAFQMPPSTFKEPPKEITPNTNNLLFGSLLESIDDVHAQSPSGLMSNYKATSDKLKLILDDPNVHKVLNSSDLNAFKDINQVKPDRNVLDSILNVLYKIWHIIKTGTITLFNIVTQLLKPFTQFFAYIQYAITTLPLIIPGITTWISGQFNDHFRLIDFFLLPLCTKISYHFSKNNIEFTPSDQEAILNTNKFEDLQFLSEDLKLKLHWADRLGNSFAYSYSVPFEALETTPIIKWLNPLWNSASFVLVIFSTPRNIFEPATLTKPDIRLHVARLFSSFLTFIPDPLVFYPNAVTMALQLAVYKIPYTVMRVQRMWNRTLDSLPLRYGMKRVMWGLHTTVDALRIGSQFASVIPGGGTVNGQFLSWAATISDQIIGYGIEWKSRLAF